MNETEKIKTQFAQPLNGTENDIQHCDDFVDKWPRTLFAILKCNT